MNFIIDAHLPKLICRILEEKGHKATHTSQLPEGNNTTDSEILNVADQSQAVIISKDLDFYHSFLLHKRPTKLVVVKVGNLRLGGIRSLFQAQTGKILELLETYDLIEVYSDKLVGVQ